MFDTLVESKPKAKRYRFLGTGLLSLMAHTLLITGLVYATVQAGQPAASKPVALLLDYPVTPQKSADPLPVDLPLGFPTIPVVTSIPTGIPPVDIDVRINPQDLTGVGIEGGTPTGVVPGNGDVLTPDLVQERPEMLSHPSLVYPELLKQAGIEGNVIAQAIVDTTGRIEASSIRILESPNPGFDQPAKDLVLKSLYRPARVYGRAVRVLIQQPIAFTLQHNR